MRNRLTDWRLNVKRRRVREVGAMTTVAPTTTAGSMLGAVDRARSGDYERSLTTLGHGLPLGWDATRWRSKGLAGYDLLLATPRTLSALGWFFMGGEDPQLGQQVHQAHREAARAVAVEFAAATGAEAPSLVGHGFDSARQPWLHAHLVYGALAATGDGFVPLDLERVEEQADLYIFGYHLLVRRAVTELIRELGLGWAPPADDGSCEVTGLPTRVLTAVEQPYQALAEIAACVLE
jgi:hypothetical protein